MAPYFDEGYEAERERYYTAAVRQGFGARPEAFRAVAGTPGLSWHTSALGLILKWQQNVLPAAARALLRPVEGPARSATERALGWARAVEKPPPPRAGPRVWLIERIPDDLFLRILERLHYPLAAFEGARAMWRELSKSLRDMTDHVRAAGRRFLGNGRSSPRAGPVRRCRSGGRSQSIAHPALDCVSSLGRGRSEALAVYLRSG